MKLKIALAIFGALAGIAGLWLGISYGTDIYFCDSTVLKDVPNASGKVRAVLFERRCSGFPPSNSIHLSVFDRPGPPHDWETGNIYFHEQPFGFAWKSEKELAVDGIAEPFLIEPTFYGFDIQYSKVD